MSDAPITRADLEVFKAELLTGIQEAIRNALAVELSLLHAPPDDEPITEEDIRASREGLAQYKRGECIPHEEILREFGYRPAARPPHPRSAHPLRPHR